ncbi:MAG: YbbR-like domain-containing protein, partial [Planctomycetota bacterium]
QVQVRLKGPQYLIKRRQEEATLNNLRLEVPLGEEDVGGEDLEIEVDPAWFNIPESDRVRLSAMDIRPEKLQLKVSRIVTRALPVDVQLTGVPQDGYRVEDFKAVPSEVEVTGPESVLDEMESISAQAVPLWDAYESFRRTVPLQLRNTIEMEDGTEVPVNIESDQKRVVVHVSIRREDSTRTIDNVPINILQPRNFPYRVTIPEEENEVSVVISGSAAEIASVEPTDVIVYLDIASLADEDVEPGERAMYKEDVNVRLADSRNVRVQSVQPEKITAVLENPQ